MEITLTETLNLEVYKLPFEVSFAWKKKRGIDKNWWFTPTGKGKIWIGSVHMEHLGEYSAKDYFRIIKEMKKYKSDILVDERGNFYTIGGERIAKLNQLIRIEEETEAGMNRLR